MREEMIKAVHIGHLGVEKSVGRARDIMFWPLMSKQITEYVLGCTICLKYRDSNPNEPLHSHDVPDRPWQNVCEATKSETRLNGKKLRLSRKKTCQTLK